LVKGDLLLGADDNASGVALMLMLAESLKDSEQNIQFVAFAGHEDGLFGSTKLAESIDTSASKPRLMINLDMVGRLNPDNPTCLVYEKSGGMQFKEVVDHASEKSGLNVFLFDNPNYNSDDLAFARIGIPTLYFTSGVHSDHHRSTDTVDKINFEGVCEMKKLIQRVIETVISTD
jgi:aminopeptidase YwaD